MSFPKLHQKVSRAIWLLALTLEGFGLTSAKARKTFPAAILE
jgi:hypothetical protein